MSITPQTSVAGQTMGCVFNIQRFSVHDGRGIRTVVFLCGCPLRCAWCSNPESQLLRPQLAFNPAKCIGPEECGVCGDGCAEHALLINAKGEAPRISVDRDRCTDCGVCARLCSPQALTMLGSYRTVDDILREVQQDSCFYSRSAGGLTVSGGEPLLQPEFLAALLAAARKQGLDTAIETCGEADWSALERVCAHLDGIFFDIKSYDSSRHQQFTGVTNHRILANFERLASTYRRLPIVVRTPVIPGFNDTPRDVIDIASFIRRFPNVSYELLPYHAFGESKYGFLGKAFLMADVRPPATEQMNALREVIPAGLRRDSSAGKQGLQDVTWR